MDYTKEDLKVFKHRDIKPEQIDRQLANFEKGFDYVDLSEPATIGNGIIRIEAEDEERLNANFDKARQECELLKNGPGFRIGHPDVQRSVYFYGYLYRYRRRIPGIRAG